VPLAASLLSPSTNGRRRGLLGGVHHWADAHCSGTTAHARGTIESQVAELVAAGRRGDVPILSIMLAEVCRL
jgi:hypothetical protein